MNDESVNHYARALEALEGIRLPIGPADAQEMTARAQARASIAATHAMLAAHDAVLMLRDEVEALPAHLEKRLSGS
jgi:uncharacterized glyoxalase superfamily protein PhnB